MSDTIISRTFNNITNTMYHGTTTGDLITLKQGVDINLCNEFTDFGKGFYLTSNFLQASRHAEKKAKLKGKPIVFEYELDLPRLTKEYNGNILNKMDLKWAKFIYNNRSKRQGYDHYFDYVFGGVADGKIFDLVNLLDRKEIDLELFYYEIAKFSSYDQLSIHNQRIFTYNIVKLNKVVKSYDKQKTQTDGSKLKK